MRLALVLLVPLLSGCTAIGYGIGSWIDNPSRTRLRAPEFVFLYPPGTTVHVLTRQGTAFRGELRGSGRESAAVYEARYRNWLTLVDSTGALPKPGEIVSIEFYNREPAAGAFRGLRPEGFEIAAVDSLIGRRVALGDVRSATIEWARPMDLRRIRPASERLELPVLDGIRIRSSGREWVVPLDDIERVEIEPHRTARTTGFWLGVIPDLFIVGFILRYGL